MKNFKLSKTALITGMAGLLGGASAHASISYNLVGIHPDNEPAYTANGGLCDFDNSSGACPMNGTSAGPWSNGNPGYTGNLPATWIAVIENAGGVAASETASSASAGFRIDMGARAYRDTDLGDDNIYGTPDDYTTNWGHTSDFGLFTLQADADVTITVSSDNSVLTPAFGLWKGWATSGNRHAAYLNNGAINPMGSVFFTGTSLSVVDANAWATAGVGNQGSVGNNVSATLTRHLAAGNYTLILGGDNTLPGTPFAQYTATISAAPVPLPAAVWLFGSAVAGLSVVGRRKSKTNA